MQLDVCVDCNQDKPIKEFKRDRSLYSGRKPWCKTRGEINHKSDYTIKYGTKVNIRRTTDRKVIADKLLEYKLAHPCSVCGESEPCCIDFHHTNTTQKDFTISSFKKKHWLKVLNEIEKCIVLCANCHRKLHANGEATT
jgi:hypothetical protein